LLQLQRIYGKCIENAKRERVHHPEREAHLDKTKIAFGGWMMHSLTLRVLDALPIDAL